MKSVVIYSSLTGNTKAVAEAVLEAMPDGTELFAIKDAPAPDAYDVLALGFWVSKSGPDPKMAAYMERVQSKKMILFGSMAGYPDSPYGDKVRNNALALAGGNEVLGVFLCQGRITEKRLQGYLDGTVKSSGHPLTPERRERLLEAAKHPSEDDFAAARLAVREFLRSK